MAVIKVACPKCGQRVSGDESFYGTTVECPVCTSTIRFPGKEGAPSPAGSRPPRTGNAKTPPLGVPRGGAAKNPTAPVPHSAAANTPPAGSERPKTAVEPIPPKSSQTAAPQRETTPIPLEGRKPGGPPPPSQYRPAPAPGEMPSPVLGVVSMVLGILNSVLLCAPGILLGPAAIILGHIALGRAKNSPIQPAPGQTMALVGLILGYIGLVMFIVYLLTYRIWLRFGGIPVD